ncbi:murein L,D-transpeptidase family protein [Thalassovita sp.]|uniref:murein L,D-transpeptidase family protein n=1 Tax=Thalassovita sp. TaxID=1979401 RepID=UPI002AB20A7C|nr:murein L,D-transpeptidase family protein [Thalassovita sp.]
MRWLLTLLLLACLTISAIYLGRAYLPSRIAEPLGLRADITEIRARVTPRLEAEFAAQGLTFGAPVYLRIFKEEAELELWVKSDRSYQLFRSYPICTFSGKLGPKLREGDRQSPEGFYQVGPDALNPRSSYHLSFNLGFPNSFDRAHGRTGSFLMVHGNCLSIGCYAMTDPLIEEIYLSVEAALKAGQTTVPVHAFPFRMTEPRMAHARGSNWIDFWRQLAPAYQQFEATHELPQTSVRDGRYHVAR